MEEQFRIEDCGVKVEIGDNLLKAIKAVLKKTENENLRSIGRVLSPGKEINKAFGINITKMHRVYIKNKNVVTNP